MQRSLIFCQATVLGNASSKSRHLRQPSAMFVVVLCLIRVAHKPKLKEIHNMIAVQCHNAQFNFQWLSAGNADLISVQVDSASTGTAPCGLFPQG